MILVKDTFIDATIFEDEFALEEGLSVVRWIRHMLFML